MKEKSLLQQLKQKQARRVDMTAFLRKEREQKEAEARAIRSPDDQKRHTMEERLARHGEETRKARASAERRFWEGGQLARDADENDRAVEESSKAARKIRYQRPEL